jgi:hypothetical protein
MYERAKLHVAFRLHYYFSGRQYSSRIRGSEKLLEHKNSTPQVKYASTIAAHDKSVRQVTSRSGVRVVALPGLLGFRARLPTCQHPATQPAVDMPTRGILFFCRARPVLPESGVPNKNERCGSCLIGERQRPPVVNSANRPSMPVYSSLATS